MTAHDTTVLDARARALAMPRATLDEADASALMPVLLVGLGDERLAIPLSAIVSITVAGTVTPLPHAMHPVYGVTAWRGRALTVLVLSERAGARGAQQMVVLGGARRATVGLLVDAVDETDRVVTAMLTAAPAGALRALAMGVTPDAVLVLDADAILAATGGGA